MKSKKWDGLASVKIKSTDGVVSSVIINGAEVSNRCFGYTLTHKVGEMPTVSLDMYVDEIEADVLATPVRRVADA